MVRYHDFEKQVFQWLTRKMEKDATFAFSLRQKATKGAETDYFIGTEKSKYFGMTFWFIPVAYPGSSGDLINLIFRITDSGYSYNFECNQTKNPHDDQNKYALEFIQKIKPKIKNDFDNFKDGNSLKFEHYNFLGQNISYESISKLLSDVDKDLNKLIPVVDKAILEFNKKHPEFRAHKLKQEEFESMMEKFKARQINYRALPSSSTETSDVEFDDKNTNPLNQILFGPPGTGKTYNTINKALEIINEEEESKLDWNDREAVKELFDKRMAEGRIVFTTFHQSMNYEDFIEGIKPVEPEKDGDPVPYRIELGVFRNICIEASFAIAQLRENKTTEDVLDFSILYDNFVENIEEKMLNGQKVELDTKTGGSVMVESISQQGNFIIKHHEGTRTYTVSKARLTKLQSAIINLDDVSNINDQFRAIIGGSNSSAYWSVLNAIRKEKPTKNSTKEIRIYSFDDKKEVVNSLSKADYKNKTAKPYVLIIDEINRGNVSQIFGELITLIEDDKRLGKPEALEVMLPYSKEKFGVPANVYIIGTMNTADRSVEALDAALRRRFSFDEMPPIPKLISTNGKLKESDGVVAGIDLVGLLETINKRIEVLLDKDHQIGHSYFMTVSNLTDLKMAFQNKIIPLLQEYFFGDYGKIGLVLGSGFVEVSEKEMGKVFADFKKYYEVSEYEEKLLFKIAKVADMSDDVFISSIGLLSKN